MPKEAFTQFSQRGDQKELLGGREIRNKKRNSIPTWGWIVGLWAGKMSKKSSSLGAPRQTVQMKPYNLGCPEGWTQGALGAGTEASSQGHLRTQACLFLLLF